MIKLDLKVAAEEFEIIDDETQLFYNKETGEFEFYNDYMDLDVDEIEKFEDDEWVSAPSQRDLDEYGIMSGFTDSISDPRKHELLSVALEGRGAFRRFKDTLDRVDLTDEWYAFKHAAFIVIAREWCEENGIDYISPPTIRKPDRKVINRDALLKDMLIVPFLPRLAEDIAMILHDVLGYSKTNAESESKHMLSSKRTGFAAIADNRVIGIVGAIPQYGVTGWELHPLAVLKDYQRHGVGSILVQTLEREVSDRGGVMIYLGSDDETGTTSLYGVDLYEDTFGKLAGIQNTGGHPFPFYEKQGYKIVGVLPDANGIGKPDIWMAKRLKRGKRN